MPISHRSVLVVDPDPAVRQMVKRCLGALGCDVVEAASGEESHAHLGAGRFDVVLADLHLRLDDGTPLLAEVERRQPGTPVITLTSFGSLSECAAAIRAGAYDCLVKPLRRVELETAVDKAVEAHDRELERQRPRAPRAQPANTLVGSSPPMHEVLRTTMRAARTEATVLITGEPGTGKQLLAQLTHELSGRARGPLVAIDCAALPPGLVERELFGDAGRAGVFAQAVHGTLVLDGVGELPMAAQAKLLRLFEEASVDVRVVAVTHRDLRALCAVEHFREDLFFRLDVMHIEAPPLRARREDIEPLAAHFLAHMSERLGRPLRLATDTLETLQRYAWPGNVRELQHLVERLALLARDGVVSLDLLPPRLRRAARGTSAPEPQSALEELENRLILEGLGRARGMSLAVLIERIQRKALN
jgi:two-component system, NtrC family, response regulator HydG